MSFKDFIFFLFTIIASAFLAVLFNGDYLPYTLWDLGCLIVGFIVPFVILKKFVFGFKFFYEK